MRDLIRETGWHGNDDDPTVEQIEEDCLKNNHVTDGRRYKLALRRTDNEILRSIVDGHPLDNDNGAEMSSLMRRTNISWTC